MRAALLLALFAASPAGAVCADREAMAGRLAAGWHETRQSVGLSASGAVLETYANPETGTWTITMTTPGGPTCIVAAGEAWEADEPAPKGELG
jgi:hypothetical protein